nr:unnamed protein product [Leishmania braziliensis]
MVLLLQVDRCRFCSAAVTCQTKITAV